MYFSLALVSAALATAAGSAVDARAKLMSHARRLDANDVDYSWIVNYSIVFESCTTVTQFNADNNNVSPLVPSNIVKFKLCHTASCSTSKSVCAEYIVDAGVFANYWTENDMTTKQYACESVRENCNCENYNDDDVCEAACYTAAGLDYCVDMQQQQDFNIQKYMECGQAKFQNNNG